MRKFFAIILMACSFFVAFAQERDTLIVQSLQFLVGTDNFIEDNAYKDFTCHTLPYLAANANYVEYIKITAGASPEGTYETNKQLSDKRLSKISALIRSHSQRLPVETSRIESWRELYHVIYNSEEPYRDDVLKILSTARQTKRLLMEHDGGRTWRSMLKKYFPDLRSATVEIKFTFPKYEIDTLYIAQRDTIYIRDTVYIHDTLYLEKPLRRIPILGVKTNLLADVVATPNVQAELYTWLWGLSLEFDYTFPWFHKDYDTYFYYQILNGTVGIRKYLNNKYTGHYFGIYANTAIYDICPFDKDKGWQGELYGAGISYGYVFQNKRHPRVKFEPYIRFGWFNTKFDTYHASQPWDEKYYYNWYLRASDFVPRRFNMNYFGPTEIGVNFTFDLICLRRY